MGSYAECWLGDLVVAATKNEVDPGLMRLFRHSDKRMLALASPEAPRQLKARFEDVNDDIDLGEIDEEPEIVYYVAPVAVIKDRMNVLGFTAQAAHSVFDEGLVGKRAQTAGWLELRERKQLSQGDELLQDLYGRELAILDELTFEVWLENTQKILRGEIGASDVGGASHVRSTWSHGREWYEGPLKGTLQGYMLSEEWFGFPSPDTTAALRLLLEVYPDADELIYDVTDLVWSEYAHRDDDFVGYTTDISIEEMQSVAKVIILTEGSSDAEILRSSLDLLYPHLSDYYSFMEFDAMRVGGGAGNLANLVKAFAGAGVVNKTIAIFDNDTAGRDALRGLANINLPDHLAVLSLPSLDWLEMYPTVGPSGLADMDVNGLAASIELYLGGDVLADDDGLCRVQWTGYNTALRQYQGQLLDKVGVQSRFQEKVAAAKAKRLALDGPDWRGLRAIFERVFSAFHSLDEERILDFTRDYYEQE